MLVKNCCCCSLRTGCLIIAYLWLIFSASFILEGIGGFVSESLALPSHLPALTQNIITVLISVAGVIFASFGLAGIYKKNKKFVFVFFVGAIVSEVITFALELDCVIATFEKKKNVQGCLLLVGFLGGLALTIYVLIVVYSYYKSSQE